MTHREGLARQGAIKDNGAEQVILFHARKDEADGIGATGNCLNGFGAVDVVNLGALVRFDVTVNKIVNNDNWVVL